MFHYNPRMLQQQQVQFQAQSQQRQVQQHTNRQRARQTQQGNKLSEITSQPFDLYGVQDPAFMVADNTAVQHPEQVYSQQQQQQQLQSLSDRSTQREQPQFSQAPPHHTLQTLQPETSRPGTQSGFENSNHMMEYVETDQAKALNTNNQARWSNQQFVGLHTDLQKPLQGNLTLETEEDALSGNNSTSNTGSPTPKVKRPMNAFLIFSVKRRRELSSQNPTLATSEISTILGDEWAKMDAVSTKFIYINLITFKFIIK